MKGLYCIYECSKNRWLMTDGTWVEDRWFITNIVPTDFDISSCVNSDGSIKHNLISRQSKPVISAMIDTSAGRDNINVFTTMNAAENYLLTAGLSTSGNEFYSIRKIYF
jgi:hypothetical protein